jgi:hypothetical protein
MDDLIYYLTRTAPGKVPNTEELETLLAKSWERLAGSNASCMVGHKLLGRIENVHWRPPIVSFAIERHVARACGLALLQHWVVDLHHYTATITKTENRTLHPLSLRLSAEMAAAEIAQAILDGENDDRLQWEEDGTACVVASWSFPKRSGFSRTLGTRRMKLCNCVGDVLAGHGWKQCGRNRFRKNARIPSSIGENS